jgi:hypothetical protein
MNSYFQSECVTTPIPTRHMPMKITKQNITVKLTNGFCKNQINYFENLSIIKLLTRYVGNSKYLLPVKYAQTSAYI